MKDTDPGPWKFETLNSFYYFLFNCSFPDVVGKMKKFHFWNFAVILSLSPLFLNSSFILNFLHIYFFSQGSYTKKQTKFDLKVIRKYRQFRKPQTRTKNFIYNVHEFIACKIWYKQINVASVRDKRRYICVFAFFYY